MTRMLAASAVLIGVMSITGCMIVDTPVMGILGSRVSWGDVAEAEGPELKEGRACMQTLLGLLAQGDASVRAAKANGKITKVSVIDHSARNFMNIVGEYCTVVRGN